MQAKKLGLNLSKTLNDFLVGYVAYTTHTNEDVMLLQERLTQVSKERLDLSVEEERIRTELAGIEKARECGDKQARERRIKEADALAASGILEGVGE